MWFNVQHPISARLQYFTAYLAETAVVLNIPTHGMLTNINVKGNKQP